MTDPAVVPEPTDDELLTIYENESYIGGVEGAHAGLRAVFDAGRDSRDGIVVPREHLATFVEFVECAREGVAYDSVDDNRIRAAAEFGRRLLAGHTKGGRER